MSKSSKTPKIEMSQPWFESERLDALMIKAERRFQTFIAQNCKMCIILFVLQDALTSWKEGSRRRRKVNCSIFESGILEELQTI